MTDHELVELRCAVARAARRNKRERTADTAAELAQARLNLLKARRTIVELQMLDVIAA